MPCARSYPGFSHRRRTLCSRHRRQFVCCGNHILQLQSAVVSAAILYNLPGDAGGCGNVYALPVVSPRGAIHPPNRSSGGARDS